MRPPELDRLIEDAAVLGFVRAAIYQRSWQHDGHLFDDVMSEIGDWQEAIQKRIKELRMRNEVRHELDKRAAREAEPK